MSAARLLVVSPPCHQPVNRTVYRELARVYGVAVHVAVPARLNVGGVWRITPVVDEEAITLSLHEVTGSHGRLQTMRGLAAQAQKFKPTHVLVDSDPASMMVRDAARACPGCQVWALTAENLPPRYLAEIIAGLAEASATRALAPLVKFGMRLLVHRHVDRVFTLSRDGSTVMSAMGFSGRVTQIPLGFDPALFRIQDRARIDATRSRLGLDAPTIAYFGRLTAEKGVHLLVDALSQLLDLRWQLLVDRFSDYPTPYAAMLQALIARHRIEDRVVYFDAAHEQMPDFMNAADVVVLPSLSTPRWKEQYGRVLPEAMACGKQVIGSDSGAIPELVKDWGDIVPEGDVAALRECLRRALQRGDFSARAAERSAYAHDELSIARQAGLWAGLLG